MTILQTIAGVISAIALLANLLTIITFIKKLFEGNLSPKSATPQVAIIIFGFGFAFLLYTYSSFDKTRANFLFQLISWIYIVFSAFIFGIISYQFILHQEYSVGKYISYILVVFLIAGLGSFVSYFSGYEDYDYFSIPFMLVALEQIILWVIVIISKHNEMLLKNQFTLGKIIANLFLFIFASFIILVIISRVPSGSLSNPKLISPKNNATLKPEDDITLNWESTNGATQYRVKVRGGKFGNDWEYPCGYQVETLCNVGLLSPGEYEWCVYAENPIGISNYCEDYISIFLIQGEILEPNEYSNDEKPQDLPAVELLSPENGKILTSDTEITLVWQPKDGITWYTAFLRGGQSDQWTGYCFEQSESYCYLGTLPRGEYEWCIQTDKLINFDRECSDLAATFMVVSSEISAPKLKSPVHQSTIRSGTDITLIWQPVAGATEYEVSIYNYENDEYQYPCTGTNDTYCYLGNLKEGEYQWCVYAKNQLGISSDCNNFRFSVKN